MMNDVMTVGQALVVNKYKRVINASARVDVRRVLPANHHSFSTRPTAQGPPLSPRHLFALFCSSWYCPRV